jgi:hypothetical protein
VRTRSHRRSAPGRPRHTPRAHCGVVPGAGRPPPRRRR